MQRRATIAVGTRPAIIASGLLQRGLGNGRDPPVGTRTKAGTGGVGAAARACIRARALGAGYEPGDMRGELGMRRRQAHE